MRITLTGATGFLGRHLSQLLRDEGHDLRILSRNPAGRSGYYSWDPLGSPPPAEALAGSQAVIHLAGEPVAQRWTPQAKVLIRRSRIEGTRRLVEALSTLSPRPEVLISASAVGYYGSRGDEELTETSLPGSGFLPEVCVEWEQAAGLAVPLGIRLVKLRIGMALGRDGGALAKMLPPFKAGVAGPLAGGLQWMSWIHVTDLARMIAWAAQHDGVHGPVNAVAPQPIRNKDFTHALAHLIQRPAVIPVPEFALRLLYGEMAGILIDSQRVAPSAARQAGFQFHHPDVEDALGSLL